MCSKSFKYKKSLAEHQKIHRNPYQCELCQKTLSTSHKLKCHIELHYKYPCYCAICSKFFATEEELNRHIDNHVERTPNGYQCNVCFQYFRRRNTLIRHKLKHSNPDGILCSLCPRKFYSESDLKRHLKWHRGEVVFRKRWVVCETCGLRCHNTSHLKAHMRIHNPGDKFYCRVCKKAFTWERSCLRHERIMHSERKELPYVFHVELPDNLEIPGQSPSIASHETNMEFNAMNIPITGYHNMESGENFSCDICLKSFKLRSSLVRHQKLHSNIHVLLSCHLCDMRFTSESARSHHLESHRRGNIGRDFKVFLASLCI